MLYSTPLLVLSLSALAFTRAAPTDSDIELQEPLEEDATTLYPSSTLALDVESAIETSTVSADSDEDSTTTVVTGNSTSPAIGAHGTSSENGGALNLNFNTGGAVSSLGVVIAALLM